ncbi:MAG: tetratricopeptide repeat protein [Myxococcales bacterium]|nr:tetratricopeptide repeat protein [Myxococcales bacterium]
MRWTAFLVAKGQFGDLKQVYARKLELTSEPEARIAILSKLGLLFENEVKDDAEAIKAYLSITDMAPDDKGALAALARLYERGEKWQELADVLQRQMVVIGLEDDRAAHLELRRKLAETRDLRLGQAASAIEVYRDMLDVDPGNTAARAALERKLDDKEHRGVAAAVLEPIYEQTADWAQLVLVQEIKVAAEADPSTRAALLLRIGELYRLRLGNAEKAADAYGRCLEQEPGNEVAQQELESLADLLDGGWESYAALLEKSLKSDELDAVQTHQMALKLGEAYLHRLGKIDRAVEAYQRALTVEPDDERALAALESIFASQERYPELLDVYRRKADIVATDAERLDVLFKIAEIQDQMLGQRDEAIAAYGEVLAQDADNLVALRALDRLFEGGGRWQDLGDNLTRQLTIVEDDAQRVPLLVRLAHVRETRLGEQAAAVETYRQALDTDAGNVEAIMALQRLGQQAEFELAVANILEPLYRDQGDATKQIGALEIIVRHSFDPAQKLALLHQIAELHEIALSDMKAAFAAHARALAEDPQDAVTLAQLERLAIGLGDPQALVTLYLEAATAAADDELRIGLRYRAARVQEEAIGDAQAAVATLEEVLKVDPSQEIAATRIQAIWQMTGNSAGLVDILRRRSDVAADTASKQEFLYRAAQLQEEVLADQEAAIATYQHILTIDDADETALAALERLFIRLERWSQLKDVYAKRADLAADPEEKKRTLYVLGQVYDRELGNTAKAIETYQQILDVDATEVPAIQALDRLLGQAERWYDLLGNLERQIKLSGNDQETVALTYRVGLLWQTHLGDTNRAVETYRGALALDPYHPETLAALDGLLRGSAEPLAAAKVLEPIYEASGQWAQLAAVFEIMVAQTEEPAERVGFLHRLAHLQEAQLTNPDAAYEAYGRALADDRSNELTIGHLERLSDQLGKWPQTGALYLAQVESAGEPSKQVEVLLRAARVFQQETGDLQAAIASHTRVLAIEPEQAVSLEALDDLYSHTQQWAELGGILRTRARLSSDENDAALYQFRLGQTLEHALGDARGAIDVYREVLFAMPTHAPTIAALESLFAGNQHQSEVIAILEPLYEQAGEFEKLHAVYQAQLAAQVAPRERLAMLQRLAELAESRLADPGRAFQWWAQALIEDPSSELASEQLERFAGDLGAWDHLAASYQQALDENASLERTIVRDVLIKRGRVLEEEIGDVAGAVDAYLRVLQLAPEDEAALLALDRLYLAAGMYDELVEVLRRRVALADDPDQRNELLFRRGEIYASVLGDLDAALGAYRAVLEGDSRNRKALEAEEEIYFRREEWAKLYATYEKLVDVAAGDDELSGVYARMARVAADALGQDDHAVDLWRRVADIRGEDAETLGAVAEIYERNGQWEPYVETLERQVAITPDEREQIALYKSMGRIWASQLARPRNAIDAWLAADRINPVDGETLTALCELYQNTQAWDELSSSLRRLIAVSVDSQSFSDEVLIAQYSQLGELEGDVLGRVDDAIEAWQQVLHLDPRNEAAITALEALYTREARWDGVVEILQQRAQLASDPDMRAEHLLQAGAIWEEKVGNLANAAQLFELVHQEAPANLLASERLESIYRSQYRWSELVEVFLTRGEFLADDAQRIALFHETARIYETELGDQESAFLVLQAAFKLDYANETTSRELERLAGATGKWAELLTEYTEQVRTLEVENRVAAAELWVKIGRWYSEHLSHVDYAMHSVQEALRIDPGHPGALVALADLQRRRGMWRELQDTLNRHIAVEQDVAARTELSLQLAELWEGQLQDPQQALYAYQQALSADPENRGALSSLERLYRRAEAWDALIDVLYRRAAVESDPEEATRVRIEIGQVYDQRVGAYQQAIEAYRRVLEIDAANLTALRSLEELYDKTNQPQPYLEVLELQLDVSPTDSERVALYGRMAAAWEERYAKLDRAADCYEKIVALDPRNAAAFRELERLYYQSGKWDALVETYRNHIPATADIASRIDLYCAMGGLYEAQLDNPDRALEAYNEALTLRQDEPRALDALGRLYERIGDWHRAVEAQSAYVRIVDDVRTQSELYRRMGTILHQQIKDPEAAESHLLHALTLDPANAAAMEALVAMYRERGDWLKAAQMMVRAEAAMPVPTDKVRLLYGAAVIYEQRLAHADHAKQLYAAVIALDPEHVEAGRPLARLYFEAQEWAALAPVVEMLVRKLGDGGADGQELNELYYQAGRAADETGDLRRAGAYYKAAYDLDPTYLPTLISRADLLYKMQDWDGAGKLYQTLLVQQRDVTSNADVVRTYFRLGMVRQHLGERKKAHNMFEKALEIDPTHRDTLLAMVALQEQQEEWESVVHAKRGLLATASEKERVALLGEIGEIYKEKLANPQKAIASFTEALDFAPNDHSLLQRLLDLYVDTQQWKKAVETIVRFTEIEKEPVSRGQYFLASANIFRDKLQSIDEAVDHYNLALDNFFEDPAKLSAQMLPKALKAFAEIDKLQTTKRAWKDQERSYRNMLKRIDKPGVDPATYNKLRVDLLHALGEVYRSRLKHYQSAVGAFELAQQLDPDNAARAEILAELYLTAGSEYADKAVDQHVRMLNAEPFKYDSYKALYKIYSETQQYDKQWCISATLAFLKKADPHELEFYEQYKPRGLAKAASAMNTESWGRMVPEQENRYISAIFAAVYQGVAAMKAYPHKDLGLKRKDKRDVRTDQLMLSRALYYAAQALGVPLPEVFVLEDNKPAEIQLANFIDKTELCPAFVVRPQLFQGKSEKELAFAAARRLTFMRPEYYLKLLLPTNTELKVALYSAIALVKRDIPVPTDVAPLVAQYLPEMQQRITPQMAEQLAQVVRSFLSHESKVNLAEWGQAAEAVSQRAGFVLCGDLEVAAKLISADPSAGGQNAVKERIKELILFSIGENYFAVRKQMGITIG